MTPIWIVVSFNRNRNLNLIFDDLMSALYNERALKIFEKMDADIYPDAATGSRIVAQEIANLFDDINLTGHTMVLCLVTGLTPLQIFIEMGRLYSEEAHR